MFEGYENVEAAKQLINLILYQSIEATRQTCILKKDEFFYFDILKCEVFDDERRLGKVVDILEVGDSYLFEIQSDQELIDKAYAKTFLFPILINMSIKLI